MSHIFHNTLCPLGKWEFWPLDPQWGMQVWTEMIQSSWGLKKEEIGRAIGCQKKGLSSTPNHWLSPTKWQIGQMMWDESEAKLFLVGTSWKGYHETPNKANTWPTLSTLFEVSAEKTCQPETSHIIHIMPSCYCLQAVNWNPILDFLNCDTQRISIMIVSYLSSATKK